MIDGTDRRMIESAVYFTAHFRKSPHEVWTIPHPNLETARADAERLWREHGTKGGRRGMVYAVQANRSSVFVPEDYHAE